ncbi:MAG: signal peptide peptidase SppA [Desulfobacteraceae bacterium]|jgi:protease-4|nr:signal peptide peptidase SppA [Desulfobacteraceae bacterium]
MKSLFKVIGNLIRGLWHGLTVCRVIIGNLVFLVLIIFFFSMIFYDSKKDLQDEAALVLSLQGDIVIQETETVLSGSLFGEPTQKETLLKDVIDAIDYAGNDKRIQLLVLNLRDMGDAGISKLQDIGEALKRFKESGKEIIAAGDGFNQSQYYLAAHADRIYLHPMGGVFLTGFGLYRQYFKTTLEKLLIQFHVFRVGTYKSALEPFLRDDMSKYAKEANLAWLTVLWDAFKGNLAEMRGMEPKGIDDYINNISSHLAGVDGDTARLALNYGLVDEIKTRDEVKEELIQLVGQGEDENTFKQIQLDEYLDLIRPELMRTEPDTPKIGVIVARGIILDGPQPAGKIGGDTLSDLIRKARLNDKIAAIVLHIDSPGGSALASEIIRNEIELTRKAGKPVIASMSSMAASGGYWISSAADEIWASPTTITGSIGIYGAFVTLEKSLDSLGIHSDGVGTTQLAGAFDPARPLNSVVADSMQLIIENNYRRFIQLVAEGRNMEPKDVEKIAQGRVWAGKTARELGLVDKFGNLQDAVQSAAELAAIEKYDVIYVEQDLTAQEKLIRQLNRFLSQAFGSALGKVAHPVVQLYGNFGRDLKQILELNDPRGIYAYCMMCEIQ